MPDLTLTVGGMTCAGCARHVAEALESVPGVASAGVPGWESGRADVALDAGAPADPAGLVAAVEAAGYRAALAGDAPPAPSSDGPAAGYGAPSDAPPTPSGDGAPSPAPPGPSDLPADAYDLVVVGGGSAAFAAALKTSELGGRAAIVNDAEGGLPTGGTCVNVGCVPSKATIRAAEAVHRAQRSAFDGVETSGRVTDFGAVLAQVRALAAELREAKYVDVAGADDAVTLVEGRARLAGRADGLHTAEVKGGGGARTLRARAVLVATGARTFVPDVPGLADSGYLTNETVWDLDEAPSRLVVLGGGYVAAEAAQAFARLGVPVTLLQRSDRILPHEDAALTDALTGFLEADGVDVRTGVSLRSVRRDGAETVVAFERGGEAGKVRASHVLLATGRRGNTADLGLEALGVTPDDRGFLPVDATLRTAVDGVFGAGDVLGDKMFVYTAAYEGALAAQNAREGLYAEADYTALPWVVFTDPQLAGVGLDLAQAEAAGIDAEATTLPMEHVPRAIAARDTRGSVTLVRDRDSDQLVGARVLAPEGSELLMEVALAIRHGLTTEQLADAFHPYLTLSEAVKLAALTFRKDVGQLSCCAA